MQNINDPNLKLESFLNKIAEIGNRDDPIENCITDILKLIVRETRAYCGCCTAELERSNHVCIGCRPDEKCICRCKPHWKDLDASVPGPPSSISENQSKFDTIYQIIRSQNEPGLIIIPMSLRGDVFGFFCLCISDSDNLVSKMVSIIKSSVIRLVEQIYLKKWHEIRDRYRNFENRLINRIGQSSGLCDIPGFLKDDFGFHSVFILELNRDSANLKVTYEFSSPGDNFVPPGDVFEISLSEVPLIDRIAQNQSESALMLSSDEIQVLFNDSESDLVHRLGLPKKGLVHLTRSTSKDGRLTVLIGAAFEGEITFNRALTDMLISLSNGVIDVAEREDLIRSGRRQLQVIEMTQLMSRNIIDDADIDPEMETIRRELDAHTCFIMLLDRLSNELRIEALSTLSIESGADSLDSIKISLNSLNTSGILRNSLHQTRIAEVKSYIRIISSYGRAHPNVEKLLAEYKEYVVLQTPLFDSFRRLQGLFIIANEPAHQFGETESALIVEIATKLGSALETRTNIYFDSLTGLPNLKRIRPVVVDRLISFEPFTLLICKITNLKEIVISRGDDIVDECMVSTAKRIRELLRRYPEEIDVGRNSGEASYTFLFPSVAELEIKAFTDDLISTLADEIEIGENIVLLHINIGACFSTDIESSEMLFNYGNLAIQSISENHYATCLFDSDMQQAYHDDKLLEKDIRESLIRRNFEAHYQPKMKCDGIISGYEALARWPRNNHYEYPGLFIEKLEKMGMIQSLFAIVFRKVCEDIEQGNELNHVSVNISPSQLEGSGLKSIITSVLADHPVDPGHIIFEFVETAMLNDEYSQTIRELKEMGFRLSLDDFGTGYARYKTLIDLFNLGMIDELKIDKVFIDHIDSAANLNFVRSINHLAGEFNVDVVVEGVEAIDQFLRVKSIDPDITIQGWIVGKAMPLKEVNQYDYEPIRQLFSMSGTQSDFDPESHERGS